MLSATAASQHRCKPPPCRPVCPCSSSESSESRHRQRQRRQDKPRAPQLLRPARAPPESSAATSKASTKRAAAAAEPFADGDARPQQARATAVDVGARLPGHANATQLVEPPTRRKRPHAAAAAPKVCPSIPPGDVPVVRTAVAMPIARARGRSAQEAAVPPATAVRVEAAAALALA